MKGGLESGKPSTRHNRRPLPKEKAVVSGDTECGVGLDWIGEGDGGGRKRRRGRGEEGTDLHVTGASQTLLRCSGRLSLLAVPVVSF